jgi:hypothetical protein
MEQRITPSSASGSRSSRRTDGCEMSRGLCWNSSDVGDFSSWKSSSLTALTLVPSLCLGLRAFSSRLIARHVAQLPEDGSIWSKSKRQLQGRTKKIKRRHRDVSAQLLRLSGLGRSTEATAARFRVYHKRSSSAANLEALSSSLNLSITSTYEAAGQKLTRHVIRSRLPLIGRAVTPSPTIQHARKQMLRDFFTRVIDCARQAASTRYLPMKMLSI